MSKRVRAAARHPGRRSSRSSSGIALGHRRESAWGCSGCSAGSSPSASRSRRQGAGGGACTSCLSRSPRTAARGSASTSATAGSTSPARSTSTQVVEFASDPAERRRRPRLQVHVLGPGPGADPAGHAGRPREPGRRRLVLAADARGHVPPGDGRGRPEPLLLPDGEHPRARARGSPPTATTRPRRPRRSSPAAVRRVALHESSSRARPPVHPDVMVVGGGIAGIHAALTMADAGKHVYLVERESHDRRPHGQVRQDVPHARLRGLHPHAEDVRRCARTRTSRCGRTPRSSSVEGFVGNFTVKVRHQPRYVEGGALHRAAWSASRPASTSRASSPTSSTRGCRKRKPIYIPFPQATPAGGRRSTPRRASGSRPASASRPASRPASATRSTSSRPRRSTRSRSARSSWPPASRPSTPAGCPQYGYGKYPNVYTSLEVERLVNAAGPTGGEVVLRDGAKPEGGRASSTASARATRSTTGTARGLLHVLAEARAPDQGAHRRRGLQLLHRHAHARARATRSSTTSCSRRACTSSAAASPRSPTGRRRPRRRGKLVIRAEDTLIGVGAADPGGHGRPRGRPGAAGRRRGRAAAVQHLAAAARAGSSSGTRSSRRSRRSPTASSSPAPARARRTSRTRVAQAGAAAAEVLALIDRGLVELEPNTAFIDEEACSGCKTCVGLCPFSAITFDEERKKAVGQRGALQGLRHVRRRPARRARSQQHLFTDEQIFAEIEGVLAYV